MLHLIDPQHGLIHLKIELLLRYTQKHTEQKNGKQLNIFSVTEIKWTSCEFDWQVGYTEVRVVTKEQARNDLLISLSIMSSS